MSATIQRLDSTAALRAGARWPQSACAPLAEPPVSHTSSAAQQTLLSIPLLGRVVNYRMDWSRRRQRHRDIARQLAARPPTEAAWGNDPKRRAVASMVGRAIRLLFDWPNAHFLPDDRLGLLLGEFCDELVMGWWKDELAADPAIAPGGVAPVPTDITFGQLVDHILRLPQPCRNCGYDLRASSERCPECGTPIVAV